MGTVEPTIGLALLAGFISFISPCVLPLIPAYIGYMSGQATRQAGQAERRKLGTFIHGVFFVLGFTIFFVGFGLLTTAFTGTLEQIGLDVGQILTRLGGVAIILFGLYIMKVLDPVFRAAIRFAEDLRQNPLKAVLFTLLVVVILFGYYYWVFQYETLEVFYGAESFNNPEYVNYLINEYRDVIYALLALLLTLLLFHKPLREAESLADFWFRVFSSIQNTLATDTRNFQSIGNFRSDYFGSLAMGTVFAAGWTPCIGPIYGTILTLAAKSAGDTGSLANAASLLTAYSLGLGLPFLAAALALNQMSGLMTRLKRNMRKIEYASGALLILIGVLIMTGELEAMTRDFQSGELGEFSYYLEACAGGVWEGDIEIGAFGECLSTDGSNLPKEEIGPIRIARMDKYAPALMLCTSQLWQGGIERGGIVSCVRSEGDTIVQVAPSVESLPVGIQVGNRAPDFATETYTGDPISLSGLQGDIVVLNFWATWCAPCREEMPAFQEIYEQVESQGVTFVAVNFFEDRDQIRDFLAEVPLDFPIAMDESGAINDRYNAPQFGLPVTYLITPDGVIYKVKRGEYKPSELVEDLQAIAAGG